MRRHEVMRSQALAVQPQRCHTVSMHTQSNLRMTAVHIATLQHDVLPFSVKAMMLPSWLAAVLQSTPTIIAFAQKRLLGRTPCSYVQLGMTWERGCRCSCCCCCCYSHCCCASQLPYWAALAEYTFCVACRSNSGVQARRSWLGVTWC